MKQRIVPGRLGAIAAIVIAGLAAMSLRVVLEGRSALAEGDDAMAARPPRPADAIAAWESAARWYLPLAPHVDDAYGRLHGFASTRHSIVAWRAIRSAALATRTLWQPHRADLDEANAAIVELAAADLERAPAGTADAAAYSAWQTRLLAADPRPATGSVVLSILGIVCWLAGMGVMIRRAERSRIRVPAAIAAAGAVAWVVGLYTA